MLETKNLKKMSRKELLELLVFVSKKNDELQKELDETKEQLNNRPVRKLKISNFKIVYTTDKCHV